MEDYTKYLSYDNGYGILLSYSDKEVLDKYHIKYDGVSSIDALMFDINECLECDASDDLEEVLIHLSEIKYYNYIKK